MVLKNSKWTFILMGLTYGGTMGLVFSMQNRNYVLGMSIGVIAGILFGLIMYAINGSMEKKAKVLFQQVGAMRLVICQGAATLRQIGMNGAGGWMFLTESAVEFYPHKMNIGAKNIPILLGTIVSTEVRGNTITIKTAMQSHTFQVVKAKEWKKQIDMAVQTVKN